MKTQQTIDCPIPGLEMVKVTYNMMATREQVRQFRIRLSKETAEPVIAKVDGWPQDRPGPFGDDVPMIVLLWLSYGGFDDAVSEWVSDPLGQTG